MADFIPQDLQPPGAALQRPAAMAPPAEVFAEAANVRDDAFRAIRGAIAAALAECEGTVKDCKGSVRDLIINILDGGQITLTQITQLIQAFLSSNLTIGVTELTQILNLFPAPVVNQWMLKFPPPNPPPNCPPCNPTLTCPPPVTNVVCPGPPGPNPSPPGGPLLPPGGFPAPKIDLNLRLDLPGSPDAAQGPGKGIDDDDDDDEKPPVDPGEPPPEKPPACCPPVSLDQPESYLFSDLTEPYRDKIREWAPGFLESIEEGDLWELQKVPAPSRVYPQLEE
jgi:hypothetical protein